jgi:hypothetical protein
VSATFSSWQRCRSLLVLLSCLVAAVTSCSLNPVTNNNNGNCDAAGSGNGVNCVSPVSGTSASAVSKGGDAAIPSAESVATPAKGTLVGSYSIDLASGYAVPLGASNPAQSAFSDTGVGDLEKVDSRLQPASASNDQLESLPGGITPTYATCSSDTDFTGMIIPYVGTSFCLSETSGLLVGGVVTALSSGDYASNTATIRISVWTNAT